VLTALGEEGRDRICGHFLAGLKEVLLLVPLDKDPVSKLAEQPRTNRAPRRFHKLWRTKPITSQRHLHITLQAGRRSRAGGVPTQNHRRPYVVTGEAAAVRSINEKEISQDIEE
jgi:hypothetical protein